MHTSDLGYIDHGGRLYIADRLKGVIITGAETVYSAEMENPLAQDPAAGSCAVIGVPDPEWGEQFYAVVVLRPGAQARTAPGSLHSPCPGAMLRRGDGAPSFLALVRMLCPLTTSIFAWLVLLSRPSAARNTARSTRPGYRRTGAFRRRAP
ncbi:AMP-binding enzyme [Streptomyces sp. NPDC055006]